MIGIKKLSQIKRRNKGEYLVYQVISTLLIATVIGYPKYACAEAINAKVTLNFAQSIQTASMSGFLNSVNISLPPKLINPLRPLFWRLSPDDLPTYLEQNNSARHIQLVLSDGYGYPLNGWKGNPPPWFDKGHQWEAYVRRVARQYRYIPNVYWDVWNEPDASEWGKNMFWDGSREQFFDVYRIASRAIREELGPDAIIGGPSYASYDAESMKAFLAFCNENDLEVNALSWHELDVADQDISAIPAHIAEMRDALAQYPAFKDTKILVNESVGQDAQHKTGDILAYLSALEFANGDGAVKACWNALDGTNNCYNGSLDGLIDPVTKQPRAAWWVYKLYADGQGTRISVMSKMPDISVLASSHPMQALVSDNRATDRETPIQIRLANTDSQGKKTIRKADLAVIPNTREAVLKKPVHVMTLAADAANGEYSFKLPKLIPHTVYVLTFRP